MLAVDTNLLVRLLVRDDERQFAKVVELFENESIWASTSVLLETHWVLSVVIGLEEDRVREGLRGLLGLPNFSTENRQAWLSALELNAKGIELADALHVNLRPGNAKFLTFDKKLAKRASRIGLSGVVEL
ncbi:MAG: hypothetical protein OHK0021_15350 [Bryobacter sp.]